MTVTQSLIPFVMAAALLTITSGLDSSLVLRTGRWGGSRAVRAGLGIVAGYLAWGGVVEVGLGELLAASATAFAILKWIGVCYLVWLGIHLLRHPRSTFAAADQPNPGASHIAGLTY